MTLLEDFERRPVKLDSLVLKKWYYSTYGLNYSQDNTCNLHAVIKHNNEAKGETNIFSKQRNPNDTQGPQGPLS